ncbi:MAG: hypothetical protein K8U03_02085 [Planctomycetia bacterium]|nr:hypothetical protein [Planctomycetia bacterium]
MRVAAAESPTAARLAEELRLVDEAIDDVESRGSVAWDSAVVTRRILERLAETGAPAND